MVLWRAAFLPHTNAGYRCCLFLTWYTIIAIQLHQMFTAALYSTKPPLQLHILFCISSPSYNNNLYSSIWCASKYWQSRNLTQFRRDFYCNQAVTILCTLLQVLLGVWCSGYGAIPDGFPGENSNSAPRDMCKIICYCL